ncbi:MAG: hypothetical protein RL885_09980 [Planctomycetota bacterium]
MIASWIFMGLLCITSIPSIVFALIARDRIRRSHGKLRGYQLTHWAVVLGLLEITDPSKSCGRSRKGLAPR